MEAPNQVNGVPFPRSVATLVRLAEKAGWTASIRAANGQWRGRDLSLVIVDFRRDGEAALAQWVNGKADTCYRWPEPTALWGKAPMSYRELTAYLRETT